MALTVAVTGASGFIGSHVCDALAEAGHKVRPVVRSGALMPAGGAIIDALDERTDWHEALFEVDVVVHAAARVHVLHESHGDPVEAFRKVNVRATERLAREAVKAGVKRMVFISSIGVLGNYNTKPFTEADEANPSNSYSQSKWEAEKALLKIAKKTGLEVTIIRPPLVYGSGVKANFLRLMQAVYDDKNMPFRMVKNKRDFLSIGNLCHFIELAMRKPEAVNQTYLICDEEALSTPELIRALAEPMQHTARLSCVPNWMLALGARMLGKERFYHSVCSSLRICTQKARDDLGWEPKENMQDALKETVEWFVREKEKEA